MSFFLTPNFFSDEIVGRIWLPDKYWSILVSTLGVYKVGQYKVGQNQSAQAKNQRKNSWKRSHCCFNKLFSTKKSEKFLFKRPLYSSFEKKKIQIFFFFCWRTYRIFLVPLLHPPSVEHFGKIVRGQFIISTKCFWICSRIPKWLIICQWGKFSLLFPVRKKN